MINKMGYLIQSDDGTNVLVDSGYPYSFIDDPPGPQGPLNLRLEMRPADYVVNRLASIGLRPVVFLNQLFIGVRPESDASFDVLD